jgi:hypothetical protein
MTFAKLPLVFGIALSAWADTFVERVSVANVRLPPIDYFASLTIETGPMKSIFEGDNGGFSGPFPETFPFEFELPAYSLRPLPIVTAALVVVFDRSRLTQTFTWEPVQKDCDGEPCPSTPEAESNFGLLTDGIVGRTSFGAFSWCSYCEGNASIDMLPEHAGVLMSGKAIPISGFIEISPFTFGGEFPDETPFNSRTTKTISGVLDLSVEAGLWVEYESTVDSVPEPSTTVLIGVGLAVGALFGGCRNATAP